MPDSITYGSYSFPDPLPAIAESDTLLKVAGKYDHKSISVQAIGFITGASLGALQTGKQTMISGFLNEYQDLTLTIGSDERIFTKCLVNSIEFSDSDLTTVLPYTVNFTSFEDETFSEYYKIQDPVNTWEYAEQDNKIIQATHTVSAKGLKVDSSDPFDNARDFVTGKLDGGFQYIGLFNSGSNGFLRSRTENIDRKTDTYGVTEVYSYSASDNPITDNGILSVSTDITYERGGQLSVSLNGSLQGNIDACTGSDLLTTGDFTPEQATEVAINSIYNSVSDYESDAYTFLAAGPTSFNYTLDTGANRLDFDFQFKDAENLDLISGTNVLHDYSVSIDCSKDSPIATVSTQGVLRYNGLSDPITSTGDAGFDNPRFLEVSGAFVTLTGQSGIFNIAKEALHDFTGVATEYELSSSYLREEPISFSIQKNPDANEISYNYAYNNSIDYSSGSLRDLKVTIKDKTPIQLNAVRKTLTSYRAAVVSDRTLGQYNVSASCNNEESDLNKLKSIVNGLCSGNHKAADSHTIGTDNISYNLTKFY